MDGKMRLGKDKKEAFAEYLKLMHLGVPKGDHTVRQVLDAYWNWAKSNLAKETCKPRKRFLASFGRSVSQSLKAADVRAYHVQKWIDDNKRIKSPTTVSDRITLIKGVMNWAVSMGYIESNPIAEMPKRSRSAGLIRFDLPCPQLRSAPRSRRRYSVRSPML